jgi:hypothetical protein
LNNRVVLAGENIDEELSTGIANLGVPKEVREMFNLRQTGMSE